MREFLKRPTTAFEPQTVQSMVDAYEQAWAVLTTSDVVNDGNRAKKRMALAKLIVEAGEFGASDAGIMTAHALAAFGIRPAE